MIELAGPRIEEDTLLALDLSDVTKKYAERLKNLGRIRDESEEELGWSCWTLNIVGANMRGPKLVPLYGRLFSHVVEGHESENVEIREAIKKVLPVRRRRKAVRHVVQSYITRWRIEDVIRFVRQSCRLKPMRCLTYHRLKALMALVTAAAYFAAVYLGLHLKLRVLVGHVLRPSKRVFGIPDFRLLCPGR